MSVYLLQVHSQQQLVVICGNNELLNDLTFRQDLMEGDEAHRPPLHLPLMLALANVGTDYV